MIITKVESDIPKMVMIVCYSKDIRSLDMDKKIIYENTMCQDLYLRDNIDIKTHLERRVLKPVANKSCGCSKKCGQKKYVFVK